MTLLVTLPVKDGIVYTTDTGISHCDGSMRAGAKKIFQVSSHCLFLSTGTPSLSSARDGSGRILFDVNQEMENCLKDIEQSGKGDILANPADIAAKLRVRVENHIDVLGGLNHNSFLLAYEYSVDLGEYLAHSFEAVYEAGQPVRVYYKPIEITWRPFPDRIRGQRERVIAAGTGQFKPLQGNELFQRIMDYETLSVDESLQLSFDFIIAAVEAPNSKVSREIESVLLTKNGITQKVAHGTDVYTL